MPEFTLDMYQTAGVAMLLFVLGRFLTTRIEFLKRCCIPAPVVGGLIFAIVHLVLYSCGVVQLSFDDNVKSFFMTLFFTSVGYTACFRLLKKGGKKVFTFLIIAIVMVCLQDVVGAALAKVFGWDMRLGLCTGSIPMVGGHGTAGSYGPLMENKLGIAGANVLAIAAATYGLVAGNVIGNPLARRRIKKLGLSSSDAAQVDHEALLELKKNTEGTAKLDVDRGTLALALIFLACGPGTLISMLFDKFNITLASYVGSMIIGIIIRNAICDKFDLDLPVQEIETIGSISLNFFLALAMMGMQLWQLADLAGPMVAILLIQTVLTGLFVYFVTFNMMGRDYDAAVLSAGHCGFGMGATPNAMANMDALTKVFGPSEKAYLIIPVCGGFFTDIVNSLILTFFMNVL